MPGVFYGRMSSNPMHLTILLEQQSSEVTAVLPGNACAKARHFYLTMKTF